MPPHFLHRTPKGCNTKDEKRKFLTKLPRGNPISCPFHRNPLTALEGSRGKENVKGERLREGGGYSSGNRGFFTAVCPVIRAFCKNDLVMNVKYVIKGVCNALRRVMGETCKNDRKHAI